MNASIEQLQRERIARSYERERERGSCHLTAVNRLRRVMLEPQMVIESAVAANSTWCSLCERTGCTH